MIAANNVTLLAVAAVSRDSSFSAS